MSNFQFRSAGASFNRGLQEMLVQREAQRRQQLLDGIMVENTLRERARLEAAAARAEQVARQADADRMAGIYGPQADLNPQAAATLQAGGYDVQSRQTLPSRTLDMPTGAGGPIVPSVERPGESYSRRAPTFNEYSSAQQIERNEQAKAEERAWRDQQARAAAAERAAQNAASLDARAEQAELDRAFREEQAGMNRDLQRTIAATNAAARGSGNNPTQGQLGADAFYSRAKDASDALEAVEGSISNWNRYIPNFLQTEAGQQYEQSKRQFVEAYLRKDSGAAIADSEYANADRTYFAQPGDSAATLKRKQEARDRILQSLQHQGSSGTGRGSGGGNTGRSKYQVTVR